MSSSSFEFDPKPHCYHATELCDDGAQRWIVTEDFVTYIHWLREAKGSPRSGQPPRQYAKVARNFLALLKWLNKPGNCLNEDDNVEISSSVVNERQIHRIPVGRKVKQQPLPGDVEHCWMGELYSEHDNPASAHRIYFGDVSDITGHPSKRIVVGGGGTKDAGRQREQTKDIAKAMTSVWHFAAAEGSYVRPSDIEEV